MQGGERGGRAGRGQDDFDRSGDLNQVTPTDSTFSVLFCSASLKDLVFISLPIFTHSLINLFVYLFIYIQRGEHFQSKL